MKLRSKLILTVSLSCMGAGLLLAGAGALCGGVPGILISSEGFQPASRSKEPYILEKTQIDPFSAAEMDLSCSRGGVFLFGTDNQYRGPVTPVKGVSPPTLFP